MKMSTLTSSKLDTKISFEDGLIKSTLREFEISKIRYREKLTARTIDTSKKK